MIHSLFLYFLLIVLPTSNEFSQDTIRGKVIDEFRLKGYPEVQILDQDMNFLTRTDNNGNFIIEISKPVEGLFFRRIGLEDLLIRFNKDCNIVEVIVFEDANYDYRSIRKENRVRKKRFDKLSELHNRAYQEGVFSSDKPCFERKFVPH